MTMHLAHPALTTMGNRKGKQKFRNAEEARKARELQQAWEQKQKEWATLSPTVTVPKKKKSTYSLSIPEGRGTRHIPSVDTGHTGAVTIKQTPQYTGDKIIGIGTMHKSNAVPIFNDEAAKDISKMRR